METITNVINQIDQWVWSWWMILLLLGTHRVYPEENFYRHPPDSDKGP